MREYRNAMKWRAKRPLRKKPRRTPPMFAIFSVVFVGTIAVTQGYLSGWFNPATSKMAQFVSSTDASIGPSVEAAPDERISFSFCHSGGGNNCVVDGDTIWLHGQKIRVADIDTPETHDYNCPAEKQLGDRATARLQEILNGGTISLANVDRDEDQYGRKLRIVMVNGKSVGDTLVHEGLARWYGNGRQPWC